MSTKTAPLPDLRPTDFLAIDTLLSEEERDIRSERRGPTVVYRSTSRR